MTTKEFVGTDFEDAYVRAFDGQRSGGFGDGGRDVIVPGFGGVQVKASVKGARAFLAESLRRNEFIPLCVGNPGPAGRMLEALKEFGAWIGDDIPKREQLLRGIAVVRTRISEQQKQKVTYVPA